MKDLLEEAKKLVDRDPENVKTEESWWQGPFGSWSYDKPEADKKQPFVPKGKDSSDDGKEKSDVEPTDGGDEPKPQPDQPGEPDEKEDEKPEPEEPEPKKEDEKESEANQLEEDWAYVVDADLPEPFIPVIPEALLPTIVANEWNPDFFGHNPLFLEPMELDKKSPGQIDQAA